MASLSQDIQGTIYTYPGNFRTFKAQIASEYSGLTANIQVDDTFKYNETNLNEDFIRKFPTGKVPAYEDKSGLVLFEANAIAYYLSNQQLRGTTAVEQAQILQWIHYSDQEILPVCVTLGYSAMSIVSVNRNQMEHANKELKVVLQILNEQLRNRTYLVGERITLADISVACDLALLFQLVIEPAIRTNYMHVTRWFTTLINQKEFQTVFGSDYELCEKAVEFDRRKYNDATRTQQQTKSIAVEDTKTKVEKEKPVTKKQPTKKVEKPMSDDENEVDEILAHEPKQKDPFADMPKPTFNMDEFKRVYSNEDTISKAIPYFWNNFDKENCSIWFCEYKYPEELTHIFKTCNLITGFYQRLDNLRKNAFASMCVFGDDKNNTIAGVWLWRGQELVFQLSPNWSTDYESYSWRRLEVDDEQTKQLVHQYFTWEGQFKGLNFSQGKIFK